MIVLGVVLFAAALAALGYVALGSADAETIRIEQFGLALETSPVVLFLAGAGVLLLAEVGLRLIRGGARRYSRTRSEIDRLRRVEAEVNANQAAQAQRDADARTAARVPDPVVEAPFVRREPATDATFGREPVVDSPPADSSATPAPSSATADSSTPAPSSGAPVRTTSSPDPAATDKSRL